MTIGTCVTLDEGPHQLKSGEYGKWHGIWWAQPPVEQSLIANLANHEVVENADGTITVSPSIEVTGRSQGLYWHGYLKAGVWASC